MYKTETFIILSIFLISLLSGCSVVSKNANNVISLVEAQDYEEAERNLKKLNTGDSLSNQEKEELNNKIITELSIKIESLIEQFKNNEVEVIKLNNTLNGYHSLGIKTLSEKINKEKASIKELITSRESFISGELSMEKRRYAHAIIKFEKVIKSDTKYQQALVYIEDAKIELFEVVKVKAEEKKKISIMSSMKYLNKQKKYLKDNNSYDSLLKEYEKQYYAETIQKIKEFRTNKEYDNAIKQLNEIKNLMNTTDEVEQLLSEITNEQEKFKVERREKLVNSMNRQYDSMDDLTRIAPKGIDPFTLNIPKGGFVFYPMIQSSGQEIDSGIMDITVVAGFSQDDWIFMDRISFNVDGKLFSWELSFGERGSLVGNGIYEWVLKNSFSESSLQDDIQTIANGDSVAIRFDGDYASRDEQLSKEQVQQFKKALELYRILNKYEL